MKVHQLKPGIYAEVGLKLSAYWIDHYGQLVGKEVKEIVFEMFEGDTTNPIPVIVFTDGTSASVMRDPEGNGPGHLEIVK